MGRDLISRRAFLRSSGAAAGLVAVGGCGGGDTFTPNPILTPTADVAAVVKADFTNLVGEMLELSHPTHGTSQVSLDTCDDLSGTFAPGTDQRDPFRLAWTGTAVGVPEDGIYTFRHPTLGFMDLFLFLTGTGRFDVHFN